MGLQLIERKDGTEILLNNQKKSIDTMKRSDHFYTVVFPQLPGQATRKGQHSLQTYVGRTDLIML